MKTFATVLLIAVCLVLGLFFLAGWCACAAAVVFGKAIFGADEVEAEPPSPRVFGQRGAEARASAALSWALADLGPRACQRVLTAAFDQHVTEPDEKSRSLDKGVPILVMDTGGLRH